MENHNDSSYFSPQQLIVIFIITFFLVTGVGAVIIFLGGAKYSLLSEILIIIPAIIAAISYKKPFRQTFRFNKISSAVFFYSLLISAAIFVIGDELDRLIYLLFPMPDELMESLKQLMQINSVTDGVVLVMSGVIFAAFAEEMLFRGILQRTIEKYRDPAIAMVLSAVFFAIIHFNPWSALQIVFLGLFLGYLAWKTNSIYPAIILHGINNLVSMILLNLPEEKLAPYSAGDHVRLHWIVLAVAVLVMATLALIRAQQEKNQDSF